MTKVKELMTHYTSPSSIVRCCFWATLLSLVLIHAARAEDLTVHYNRPDADYDGWSLWTWNADSGKSQEIFGQGVDTFGMIFRLKTEDYDGGRRIGMVPKLKNWEQKDSPDRFWTPDLGIDLYFISSDKTLYPTRPRIVSRVIKAMIDDTDRIRIFLSKSFPTGRVTPDQVVIRDGQGRLLTVRSAKASEEGGGKTKIIDAQLQEEFPLDGMDGGSASFFEYEPGPLRVGKILDRYHTNFPLGAQVEPNRTVFRTFAPTAIGVTLRIYEAPTGGAPEEYTLYRMGNGIWGGELDGDYNGRYYTYFVKHAAGEYEVIDPYSRCNTAHNGRGMVVADQTPVSPGPVFPPQDAIIYELHIRDFTIDPASGIDPRGRGKYLGVVQEGTRYADDESILTGLDHLKELGVNVVQIMPIQDFDNTESSQDYNWGYMPVHFFSPDGWYASRRDDATRIREFKRMIDGLHQSGIKAVIDVVFNHTAEGSPTVRFSFNGLAPNYYYRLRDDGTYWNGSGTGNEFRSESPMGRKLILDSMKYWVTEFGVDGFRFDLMGLIDLETLKQAMAELRAIKPDILIYGEPWAGGETPIDKTEKGDQRGLGFGVFNDNFRDGIKGNLSGKNPGFVQAWPEVQRIKKGIKGSITDFTKEPTESINYAEAHDNQTLWDRIVSTTSIGYPVTDSERIQMDEMAAALVLTSQGIPFLQAGQEMLRTKEGEDNSYNSPDRINQIHWKWKKEHRDVFEYYKSLVHLRRQHPMFRMGSAAEVKNNIFFLDDDLGISLPSNSIGYVLHRGATQDEWADALLLFNAKSTASVFRIPVASWKPVELGLAGSGVAGGAPLSDTVVVPGRTTAIFYNRDATFFEKILNPVLVARKPKSHPFTVSAPKSSKVAVAGSFNDWKSDEFFLQKQPNGKWRTVLELAPGTYDYKFIADGDWMLLNEGNQQTTIR